MKKTHPVEKPNWQTSE